MTVDWASEVMDIFMTIVTMAAQYIGMNIHVSVLFSELPPAEVQKLVNRLAKYVSYKVVLLPFVISFPSTLEETRFWSNWLTLLCTLKIYQALNRDRFRRLILSPRTTSSDYFRVYICLSAVLTVDAAWMIWQILSYRTKPSTVFLLFFFEPLSVAFETLQALFHGFELHNIWLHHSGDTPIYSSISKLVRMEVSGGSQWKWKRVEFFLEIMSLLMAVGHDVQIVWLNTMTFPLVLLHIIGLLSAVVKRTREFIYN